MDVDERLDQLSRRLSWRSAAPIDTVASEILGRLSTASLTLVAGLRWAVQERPLITLLLSVQFGYLVGRMGHRYALR